MRKSGFLELQIRKPGGGGNKWDIFKGYRKSNYVLLKLGCTKEN